ncbi:N-acetylgalactosamine 6-sulfate sulfatase [Zobellia sp. OII3]|uniref:arylsulfatase n=1 Tax=Zobellia sp. OII3 TaxID=2034520 RepID=UPI000B537FB2|nr:arylsulfatase [Zobellia sp. OII3]OWW24497.1 N-acetylgalactosamine 6-sulfate sulfatase [Zobellia sp. OII3]
MISIYKYSVTGLLLFFLLVACNQKTVVEEKKPNVIVILSDDQGWGDFSLHGNTNLSTPNIDDMARSGAQFRNFYVQPVCSPTRAEFLTGRYSPRGGVYSTSAGGERLDLDEVTIADVFKHAGYNTAAYGKWHNGMQYPYHPNGRGFNTFYGFTSGHWGNYFSPVLDLNGSITHGNGYLTDDLTTHAISFIKENKTNPFFLYLPMNTPHAPMQVPDVWYDKFKDIELTNLAVEEYGENIEFTKAALAMCENIDWNVGRILETLSTLNLEENTIVVYFNDNGPNEYRWNGRMKGKKSSTDEGGVRSPLFVKWPKRIKGKKIIDNLSGAIDLLPTLVDLANIQYKTNKPIDGVSLKEVLLSEDNILEDRVLVNQWKDKISIRNQEFRLDHNNALFNIELDREQENDVSNQYPDMVKTLVDVKEKYINDVLSELPEYDTRSYPLGHPETKFTQFHAGDARGHGNIVRSNRFPNCSFLTNWKDIEDVITWDVEVMESAEYKVTLYYTCKQGNEGSELTLSLNESQLGFTIEEPHDPPLEGMENDRVKRKSSYVKDFKPLEIGTIPLRKGFGELVLKADKMAGSEVIDVSLLLFEKVGD